MKALIQTSSKLYWSQKAYDRWLAGLDPQDMPLYEAWTKDKSAAAKIRQKIPPVPYGCELVPHDD
jgi:hypothetical protein